MFANLASGLTSLFSQPTVLALSAGVLAGAVTGGTLLATGTIPLGGSSTPDSIALLACPDIGPELGRVPAGQTLLVTGRSPDRAWFEVFLDQPGIDRAWVPASVLRLESSADALPVAVCGVRPSVLPTLAPPSEAPSPGLSPSVEPSVAPSIVATVVPGTSPSPTPKASKTPAPSSTPTITIAPTLTPLPPPPTIPPDVTAPVLSNMTATGDPYAGEYYIQWPSCGYGPYASTIQVTAIDPDDEVTEVTLYVQPSSGSAPPPTAMFLTTTPNRWQGTITSQNGWGTGLITYYVRAKDSHGNWSDPYDYSASYTLKQGSCGL